MFVIKKENLELFRETVGERIEKAVKVEYAFQDIADIPENGSIPEGRVKPWVPGTDDSNVYAGGYVPSYEGESVSCLLRCAGWSHTRPSVVEATLGGCAHDGG